MTLSVIGLVLDLAGAVLLAIDLWVEPTTAVQDDPDDYRTLLPDIIAACREALLSGNRAALDRIEQRALAVGMATTAAESTLSGFRGRLRTSGRTGLVLLAFGFALQIAGILVGPQW